MTTYINENGQQYMCEKHPDRIAVHVESRNMAIAMAGSVPSWFKTFAFCDECAPEEELTQTINVRRPVR